MNARFDNADFCLTMSLLELTMGQAPTRYHAPLHGLREPRQQMPWEPAKLDWTVRHPHWATLCVLPVLVLVLILIAYLTGGTR